MKQKAISLIIINRNRELKVLIKLGKNVSKQDVRAFAMVVKLGE